MIVIIDYQAGNLTSVKRALDHLGLPSQISADPAEVRRADRLIFPGVGHAATAMQIYRTVQAGPNNQFGGFHDGLASVAYQVGMLGVVATEPSPASAKQMTRITTRPIHGCLGVIGVLIFVAAPGEAGSGLERIVFRCRWISV